MAIWVIFPICLLLTCIFAWLRGSMAERCASALIFLANVVGEAALAIFYPTFPGAFLCILDFGLAVGLLVVALRYSSFWLGGAMLLQSASLCLQALNFNGDGPSPVFRVIINDAISFSMLLCVVLGTIASWRARLRSGQKLGAPTAHQALGAHP